MPQQQTVQLPPGFTWDDEKEIKTARPSPPPKWGDSVWDIGPNPTDIASKFSTQPGTGLSFLNSAMAPFSMFDTRGSFQVPPVVSNMGEMAKGMLFQSKDQYSPEELQGAGPKPAAVGMANALVDTFSKLKNGSTQERAQALGDVVANIVQGLLMGKVGSMLFPEGIAPKGPAASTPQIGTGPIPAGASSVTPPKQITAGAPVAPPTEAAPIDVPFKAKPAAAQIGAKETKPLSAAPPAPKVLPAGKGGYVPPSTGGGNIPTAEPDVLPQIYQETKAPAPPTAAGTFGIERNLQGQEGGIPSRGEQTVTPTPVPHIAVKDPVTGKFRKMTPEETSSFMDRIASQRSNVGKGENPAARAPSPPPKPKPTPKGKK